MKLIRVNKSLNVGKFNYHYINTNHIVDVYEWSGQTIILLSTGDKIECLDSLNDILSNI